MWQKQRYKSPCIVVRCLSKKYTQIRLKYIQGQLLFPAAELTEKIQYAYYIYSVLLLIRTVAVTVQAMYKHFCSLRCDSNTPAKILFYYVLRKR